MSTIETRTGTYYDEPGEMRIIEKFDEDGTMIAELYADLTTGQIMQVYTEPEYRGEGHATSLVEWATENGIELLHSPEWSCTDDGKAFVEACDIIDTIEDEDAYGWEDFQSTFTA